MGSLALPPTTPAEAAAEDNALIRTDDGRALSGRWFRPHGPAALTVVLHGATGAPQRFYAKFAAWLAQSRKAQVLTYDYRDFGASRRRDLRRSDAGFLDWAVKDQAAALSHAVDASGAGRVSVIGHSLGGLCLTRPPSAHHIDAAVAVASGPPPRAGEGAPLWAHAAEWTFWNLHGPLLVRAFGYLPGRWSGLGADLPANVYFEWRRWRLEPGFDVTLHQGGPRPGFTPPRFPVALVAIADDPLIPPATVWRLAERYRHARIERVLIAPKDLGLPRLGHLGVFSEKAARAWPLLADAATPLTPPPNHAL